MQVGGCLPLVFERKVFIDDCMLSSSGNVILFDNLQQGRLEQLTLILNLMHKTKTSITPQKQKQKSTSPSPLPKKSALKVKDRLSPHSPRSTRIHTLQTKPSPQIHKKNKHSTDLESPLRMPLSKCTQNKEKGYQTPKFKCEAPVPRHPPINNFFSFGQKQGEKVVSFKYLREKQNLGGQRCRKEGRFR